MDPYREISSPPEQDGVGTVPQPTVPPELEGTPLPLTTPYVDPARGGPEPGPAEPRFPRQVGRYRLRRVLGRGGMGVVYLGRDEQLGRDVALKMIRSGATAHDEDVARFRREAAAVAALDHPHIVRVYEIGEHEGECYFTLSVATGGSLTSRLAEYRGDARACAALIEKVARAVQHAHEHGVLHRDLKPGNILLDAGGEPLVADFGLAKRTSSGADMTRTGAVVGTPAYMAPEQAAEDAPRVGPASDIWALGVILYELFSGQRPFSAQRTEVLLKQLREDDPLPLTRDGRPTSRELEAIILHCLEKEPRRRYASAGALAADLRCFLDGEEVSVRVPGRVRKVTRALRRRPRLVTAVTFLLLAATTALGAWVWLDPERPARSATRRVEKGEKVVLLPAGGVPAYFRATLGAGEVFRPRPGKEFTIGSTTVALFELLPRPPAQGCRISAEVRQEDGNQFSRIGLYALHEPAPTRTSQHVFFTFDFNEYHDPGLVGLGRRGNVCLHLRRRDEPGTNNWHGTQEEVDYPSVLSGDKPSPWRRLVMDVTPTQIAATWDGEPLPVHLLPDLQDYFVRWGAQEFPNLQPQFRPDLPMGLYVEHGAAEFRNVVVEPLP